jgi:hypothetical protein
MIKFDPLNVMFSLALLKDKKVPREKALAASIGAGLLGGPMGLLLPVMVAGGSGSTGGTTTTTTTGKPAGFFGGTVKVAVPEVVGQSIDDAAKSVSDAGLRSTTSITYTDEAEHGAVVQQDPESGRLVPEASVVDLTVAAPPTEDELSESEKEDKILEVVESTAEKVDHLLALKKNK